jgi:hypothetical protein
VLVVGALQREDAHHRHCLLPTLLRRPRHARSGGWVGRRERRGGWWSGVVGDVTGSGMEGEEEAARRRGGGGGQTHHSGISKRFGARAAATQEGEKLLGGRRRPLVAVRSPWSRAAHVGGEITAVRIVRPCGGLVVKSAGRNRW